MNRYLNYALALIATVGITLCSCKKSQAPEPKPTSTGLDVTMLLGAKWTTTAATAVKKSDGSTVTITGSFLGSLYLSDVTFLTVPSGATSGTANESDYGDLTWTYDSLSNTISILFSSVDGSAIGTITKLDAHTLILHRTGNPPDDGKIYTTIDQTLTR